MHKMCVNFVEAGPQLPDWPPMANDAVPGGANTGTFSKGLIVGGPVCAMLWALIFSVLSNAL